MGRTARGVRGVTLDGDDRVVDMVVLREVDSTLLAVTEHGFGKRSPLEDYRITNRGGKGIYTVKTTSRTGALVTIKPVSSSDELMLISRNGILIRLSVSEVAEIGRNTQGVRLMKPGQGDEVISVARVVTDKVDTAPDAADVADAPDVPGE